MMQPGQRPAHRFGGDSVYLEPDPVTVARVWRTHGWTAVAERWFYKSHTELKTSGSSARSGWRRGRRVAGGSDDRWRGG